MQHEELIHITNVEIAKLYIVVLLIEKLGFLILY